MHSILVIEDDWGVRDFIRQAVQEKAWSLQFAATGQQALTAAREHWPTVILLDLTLPGALDGWEVWYALQEMSAGRPLRVLVFAGQISHLERSQAYKRGALNILRKPISKAHLLITLSSALAEAEYAA